MDQQQQQTTTAAEAESFNCPKCRRGHPWSAEHVGRLARCACGHVLKVPPAPAGGPPQAPRAGAPARSPSSHLPPPLPPHAAPSPLPPIPSSGVPVPPPLPAPARDGPPRMTLASLAGGDDETLDARTEAELAAGAEYAEQAGEHEPDPFREVKLPSILLAVGLLLTVAQAAYVAAQSPAAAVGLIIGTVLSLGINVALMLVGVFLAAKFAGICFGDARTAVLKLCAIYVGPTMLGTLVTQALGGDIAVACLGWGVSIVCYWGLTSYLFRLDGAQTMTCVFTIGVVRVAASFLVGMLAVLWVAHAVNSNLDELSSGGPPAAADVEDADLAGIEP